MYIGTRTSAERLAERFGQAPVHFAYPYGRYAARDPARVARHYRTAVTTDMRALDGSRELHRLPRIDAYYLRHAARHLPLFGGRTRRYLRLRALLRAVRSRFVR